MNNATTTAKIYTILSSMSAQPITFERFADACASLAALRHNQPQASHSLFDADGYIVPSSEILKGLAIIKAAAEYQLQQIAAYEYNVAPAYTPEATAPAAVVAEQAIKRAQEAQAKLPADAIFEAAHEAITDTHHGITRVISAGSYFEAGSALRNYLHHNEAQVQDVSMQPEAVCPEGCIELTHWLYMNGMKMVHRARYFVAADTESSLPAPAAAPVAMAQAPAEVVAPTAEAISLITAAAAEHAAEGQLPEGITAKEAQALAKIYNSDYHDGEQPVGNPVWSEAGTKGEGAVHASLIEKGLIGHQGKGSEAQVWLTEKSRPVLQALGLGE